MKSKKIKIYNSQWTIKWFDEWPNHVSFDRDGDDVDGYMCWEYQEIGLRTHYTDFAARKILIHELSHAISWLQGINMAESFDEELFCEFMAAHYDEITKILNKVYK